MPTRYGTPNDDVYYVDDPSDEIIEQPNEGNDTVFARVSYTLTQGSYIEVLSAADQGLTIALTLTGNEFQNYIYGNAGANLLIGNGGPDVLIGFGGDDTYIVDSDDQVIESAGNGFDVVASHTSYVLAAGVSAEVLATTNEAGNAAIALTGNAFSQTIYGNAGDNVLNGAGGPDTLIGLGGNDIYHVDDAGDAVIEGNGGGGDIVFASVNYVLATDVAVEVLSAADQGAAIAISLTGNNLANYIYGNAGANLLVGNGGADTLVGFGGNDTYIVDGDDQVIEGANGGFDTIGSHTSFTLAAGSEVEVIATTNEAGTAAIALTGNAFDQTIYGNAGSNTLVGNGGHDILIGLGGSDTYIVDSDDIVAEGAGGGFDLIASHSSYVLAAGVEVEVLATTIEAGTAAINLTGNAFNQTLYGNAGNNVLNGGGGADVMVGLGGHDTYYVDNAGDYIVEGVHGGNDTLFASVSFALAPDSEVEVLSTIDQGAATTISLTGSAIANYIYGNQGANVLVGNGGADTLVGFGGNDTYVVDGDDNVIETAGGGTDTVAAHASYVLEFDDEIELLATTNEAGTAPISLTGNKTSQTVYGNAGDNFLSGGGYGGDGASEIGGADTLIGLGGNDTYLVNSAGDRVIEGVGGGVDKIITWFNLTLTEDQEIEFLEGFFTSNIQLTGNHFNQTLRGSSGQDRLDGRGGADVMIGGQGFDQYYVDNVGDQVIEALNQGDDQVYTTINYMLAHGQAIEQLSAADQGVTTGMELSGNEFNQYMYGTNGADVLRGDLGNDLLVGFDGADRFVFDTRLSATNIDNVHNFDLVSDRIVLDRKIFTSLATGVLAEGALAFGTTATQADDRILYDNATGNLYYDSDGAGGVAAIIFARLAAGQANNLYASSFEAVGTGETLPPVVAGEQASVVEGPVGNTASGNVLTNDYDPEGYAIMVNAVNGSAGNVGTQVVGTYGRITIAANGAYSYALDTADPDTIALTSQDVVTEAFQYTVRDEQGATASANVTITITGSDATGPAGGSEFLVNTATAGSQGFRGVAPLSDGRVVALWSDTAFHAQIFGLDGQKEGVEINMAAPVTPVGDITALDTGGFAVAWRDGRFIRGQAFDMTGAASGAQFGIEAYKYGFGGPFFSPYVIRVEDLAGPGYVVAWAEDEPAQGGGYDRSWRVESQTIADNGTLGARVVEGSGPTTAYVALDGLASGDYVVGYSVYNGGLKIYAKILQPDGDLTSQFQLTQDAHYYIMDVAGLAAGGFAFTYNYEFGTPIAPYVRATDATGSVLGPPVALEAGATNAVITPLEGGGFLVTYTAPETHLGVAGTGVRAQLFTATGTAVGAPFIVNEVAQGNQSGGDAIELDDGRILFLWTDDSGTGGDASGASVKGRIFEDPDGPFPAAIAKPAAPADASGWFAPSAEEAPLDLAFYPGPVHDLALRPHEVFSLL